MNGWTDRWKDERKYIKDQHIPEGQDLWSSFPTSSSLCSSYTGHLTSSQTALELAAPANLVYSHDWLLLTTQVSDHPM